MQGQGLRDRFDRLQELDVTVLGASFDTPEDNRAFAEDQNFPFRLLSDGDRSVGASYEVAREASDPFADYPNRYAYLIDRDGVIYRSYDVTDVAAHAAQVVADLEAAGAAE